MYLAQGAQYCPNCQLNLAQFTYQQQASPFPPVGDLPESKKEKLYRKVLIGICIAMFAEMVIHRLPDLAGGSFLYTLMKPFNYVSAIAWAGLPLFIALVLPKEFKLRTLFIVFASIYAVVSLWYWVYYQFLYDNLWDNDINYAF
jgi:hypothetical protein